MRRYLASPQARTSNNLSSIRSPLTSFSNHPVSFSKSSKLQQIRKKKERETGQIHPTHGNGGNIAKAGRNQSILSAASIRVKSVEMNRIVDFWRSVSDTFGTLLDLGDTNSRLGFREVG